MWKIAMVWAVASLVIFIIKKTPLKIWTYKGKRVRTQDLYMLVVGVATILSLILALLSLLEFSYLIWKIIGGTLLILAVLYLLKKYASQATNGLKRIPFQSFILPVLCILGVNILFRFITSVKPEIWQWYWKDQSFFWSWNIGLLAIAFLSLQKDDKGKMSAVTSNTRRFLIFLMAVGLGLNLYHRGPKIEKDPTVRIQTNTASREMSQELILDTIAECESGRKQFDDEGNPIVNVNTNGSRDYGALQINDLANAELIAKHPELDYKKSKRDNYELAKLIVLRDGDYRAWNATKACWEPKLALLSGKPVFTPDPDVFEAPVGKFSEWVSIPLDHNAYWGRSEGAFIIENDRGVQARFDPANDIVEDLPHRNKGKVRGISRRLRAIAMGEKPGKVVIDYKPKNQ